VPASGRP